VTARDRRAALDARATLDACVSADTLRCAPQNMMVPVSVPSARPTGASLYEADALTWRFYRTRAARQLRGARERPRGVRRRARARAGAVRAARSQPRGDEEGREGLWRRTPCASRWWRAGRPRRSTACARR
jgi:hypothetical protein